VGGGGFTEHSSGASCGGSGGGAVSLEVLAAAPDERGNPRWSALGFNLCVTDTGITVMFSELSRSTEVFMFSSVTTGWLLPFVSMITYFFGRWIC